MSVDNQGERKSLFCHESDALEIEAMFTPMASLYNVRIAKQKINY